MTKPGLKALVVAAATCLATLAPASAQSLDDCSLPDAGDKGPVGKSLYVVGTFADATWIHVPGRKMSYKGNGIYQAVIEEQAGKVTMQFATVNWTPQYTAKDLTMAVGTETAFGAGGFEKDTAVSIPSAGTYVWAIQVDDNKKAVKALVAKCN